MIALFWALRSQGRGQASIQLSFQWKCWTLCKLLMFPRGLKFSSKCVFQGWKVLEEMAKVTKVSPSQSNILFLVFFLLVLLPVQEGERAKCSSAQQAWQQGFLPLAVPEAVWCPAGCQGQ